MNVSRMNKVLISTGTTFAMLVTPITACAETYNVAEIAPEIAGEGEEFKQGSNADQNHLALNVGDILNNDQSVNFRICVENYTQGINYGFIPNETSDEEGKERYYTILPGDYFEIQNKYYQTNKYGEDDLSLPPILGANWKMGVYAGDYNSETGEYENILFDCWSTVPEALVEDPDRAPAPDPEPERTPDPEPEPAPVNVMQTTNINGRALNTWEAVTSELPVINRDTLDRGVAAETLLSVDVTYTDKTVPVDAVRAMKNSKLDGMHVYIGQGSAITFLARNSYSGYRATSFEHIDSVAEGCRVVDFTSKGKIGGTVVFHTVVDARDCDVNVYKVDGEKKTLVTTTRSDIYGRICFPITETARYSLEYI